jgi:hypothetical protein
VRKGDTIHVDIVDKSKPIEFWRTRISVAGQPDVYGGPFSSREWAGIAASTAQAQLQNRGLSFGVTIERFPVEPASPAEAAPPTEAKP